MKRFLTIALLLAAVAPASACDIFGMFRCRPCRPQPTCVPQYLPAPGTRVVHYTPHQPAIIATSPATPVIIYPANFVPCPNGRCPLPQR